MTCGDMICDTSVPLSIMFHINFYYEENPIKCDFLSQVTLRNHAMMYKKKYCYSYCKLRSLHFQCLYRIDWREAGVINRWSTNRIMSNKPFNFSCRSPQTIVHLHTHPHTHTHMITWRNIYIDYMHLCQYEFNWNECLFAWGMQAKHKSCHFFLPPKHAMCDDKHDDNSNIKLGFFLLSLNAHTRIFYDLVLSISCH